MQASRNGSGLRVDLGDVAPRDAVATRREQIRDAPEGGWILPLEHPRDGRGPTLLPVALYPDGLDQRTDSLGDEEQRVAGTGPERHADRRRERTWRRPTIFRTRDLRVRQRTRLTSALRGRLAEHGVGAPQGILHVKRPADVIGDETTALPARVGARNVALTMSSADGFALIRVWLASSTSFLISVLQREGGQGHERSNFESIGKMEK